MPPRKRSNCKAKAPRQRVHFRGGKSKGGSQKSGSKNKVGCKKLKSGSNLKLPMEGPKTMEHMKFNSYIKKVMKKVNPNVNLNRTSMKIMDSLMKDTLHQIAETASERMGKKKTLKPKVILRAMKKVMPRNLALTVDAHAQKALDRYSSKKKKCR
ncbi:hypothetical protein EGW08_003690 [Elysia chlorotica]|uniref:Histone H2A/H2B/H3 domain-containing protein n=1 Tax=Elysia chlorotica TaxID=188477 RepID=A0A3S1BHT2_ELYCH|nr:hypothetical protein EGW08_003690 [Elysia chlorotica]